MVLTFTCTAFNRLGFFAAVIICISYRIPGKIIKLELQSLSYMLHHILKVRWSAFCKSSQQVWGFYSHYLYYAINFCCYCYCCCCCSSKILLLNIRVSEFLHSFQVSKRWCKQGRRERSIFDIQNSLQTCFQWIWLGSVTAIYFIISFIISKRLLFQR